MDRILLNRWVSRAGNAAFIISVLLFVKRQVSGWKPETLLIVVLLAAGVVLMALPYLARRKQSKGLEDKTGLPSDLADELRKGHAIRKQARFAKDRDELVVACQDFIDWGFAMNDLLREAAPELYSDVPQTAPFAFEGKGRVLEHMDARLRAHSDTVKRLQGRPSSPMGVGRAGRSRLLRELRDLIHEGEDLLATLPDPAKGDESVVFPARFTYLPKVQEWDAKGWDWVRENCAEHIGYLSRYRDNPQKTPSLREMPKFMGRRIEGLRKIMDRL